MWAIYHQLLCSFESLEAHLAIMSDLQRRVLPGKFLSEYPVESAFCLRLLHPNVLSRPTTRYHNSEIPYLACFFSYSFLFNKIASNQSNSTLSCAQQRDFAI